MPDRDDTTGSGEAPRGSRDGGLTSFSAAVALVADIALKLGGLILVGSICYLIYGLVTVPSGLGLPAPEKARVLGNFALALRGILWGGAIVSAALFYRLFNDEAAGYIFAILGCAGVWGAPFIGSLLLPRGLPGLLDLWNDTALRLGYVLLALGCIIIAADLIWRARESWGGRRRMGTVRLPAQEKLDQVFGGQPWRCWQTSYCRPFVRAVCPRHDERKPCWKVKEGCFCEERVITRALDKGPEGNPRFFSQMRGQLASAAPGMTLTPREKRLRCRRCPIYAEHQRFKYRVLMPFAFPIAAAAAIYASHPVRQLLEVWVPKADSLVARFSFGVAQRVGAGGESGAPRAYSDFDIQMIYFGVMVFLAIMMLTWLLRLVEYLSFKVQV